jgi:hypothetical protein
MTLIRNAACCLIATLLCFNTKAQLYKIAIENKIDKASLIVEGKVVSQQSFWNAEHTLIYTSNIVRVYKLFKGKIISKEIEVLTQGGSVGNRCLVVSDLLQLRKNEIGMFFCTESSLHSPVTKNILYDVYSSAQGFLKYDLQNDEADAPFASYKNISKTLYSIINKRLGLGKAKTIIDSSVDAGNVSNGTGGTLGTITSFSPATVHAGAINDPDNNVLTINGSGFGNSPSGSAGVKFKDGNNDKTNPTYKIDYNSPYIISWSDTKIVLDVPDRAATGRFAVVLSDGTTVTSSKDLTVFFAVLDAEFTSSGKEYIREPRLMNANGSGGYTVQYSTSTAGKGINFETSPAKETFERALATWKEILGANITVGTSTSLQKIADDGVNLVVFDNNNIGDNASHMADGVLEATYSWFSACQSGSQLLTAQKTGFDILIRNNGVSEGSDLSLDEGPCFPGQGSYDLEMIILHELGHALNLAHINSDYEDGGNGYATVNPSAVMHYAILDYVNRRSPDAAAYQGALYTITPQHNTYGNCTQYGLFTEEMTPLAVTPITNDECPSTFPSTELQNNTEILFDLVHATSNKFNDPSFEQVNCKSTGTFVTNNAYYAFMNGTNTTLTLNITNYTLTPASLSSCNGQGIRMALYDVSSCPEGQNYPQPVACSTFSGDGTITVKNLETDHRYLLYFDGIRNTKASFSVKFNGDGSGNPSSNTILKTYGNPVSTGTATFEIDNAAGSFYQYALFDITGKLVAADKIMVLQSTQTFKVYTNNLASGVYVIRLMDENGNAVAKSKILNLR